MTGPTLGDVRAHVARLALERPVVAPVRPVVAPVTLEAIRAHLGL